MKKFIKNLVCFSLLLFMVSISIPNITSSEKSQNLFGTQDVSAATIAAWAPNTAYKTSDLVSYNGVTYKCIQGHTSLTGWEPINTPALWNKETTTTPTNPTTPTTPTNPTTPTTPTTPGQSNFPNKVFVPYVDATAWPTFNLTDCFNKTGQKYYTLAFITSDGTGNPSWGGYSSLGMNSNHYVDDINSIRSKGGDVIVSFGGATGTELADVNSDAKVLQEKYQQVINKYNLKRIDLDIEGAALTNKATVDTRNKALAALEKANPNLTVSYTLPVLPSGLTSDGKYILTNAVQNGVRLDLVNIMAMDYGDGAAPNPNGKMGTYAIDSAKSTYNQCVSLGINTKIGVTPMIGQNDVQSEIFYQADAQTLLNWANNTSYVSGLSMWSSTRDFVNGTGLYNYSKVNKSDFEFTNIFKSFTK
jgi:chitinase